MQDQVRLGLHVDRSWYFHMITYLSKLNLVTIKMSDHFRIQVDVFKNQS